MRIIYLMLPSSENETISACGSGWLVAPSFADRARKGFSGDGDGSSTGLVLSARADVKTGVSGRTKGESGMRTPAERCELGECRGWFQKMGGCESCECGHHQGGEEGVPSNDACCSHALGGRGPGYSNAPESNHFCRLSGEF